MLPVLVPWGVAVVSGMMGIDFGRHWDERVHEANARHAIEERTVLPARYTYPGVPHLLTLASIAPEVLAVRDDAGRAALAKRVGTPWFSLRVRGVFLVASSLAIVFVYLLVLVWRGSVPEAMVAACALGFSWEATYHMRFIAPDALMTALATLAMIFVMRAHASSDERGAHRSIALAAISAGLACAAKYPLALVALPVLAVARLRRSSVPIALGLLALAFLGTTPGAILEPGKFWDHVLIQADAYSRLRSEKPGSQLYSYRITPGPAHALRALDYLAGTFLSHTPAIAFAMAGLALVGAVALVREERRNVVAVFGVFPLVYLSYMSLQRIMVVRNLLPLGPFLAVLVARGVAFLFARLPALRTIFASAVALAFAANAFWLFHAAGTIKDRHTDRFVRELAYGIEGRPAERYLLSPRIAGDMRKARGVLPANASEDPSATADLMAVTTLEALDPNAWPGNRRQPAIRRYGPLPINLDYYPNWSGDPTIAVLPMPLARSLHVRGLEP